MVERVEITDENSTPEEGIPAVAESVEVSETGEAAESPRPEWLPEQFNSPEDLAKAYGELRTKMDGGKPQEGEAAEGEEAPADQPTMTPDTLQKYSAKYFTEGLSDQDYADLERMGISRELVGQYAAGQSALMDQQTRAIYNEVGGQQEYEAMIQWAGENLQPQEIEAFNSAISSGDQTTIMMATRGLHTQYVNVTGKEANLIGGNTSASGEGRFESTAQIVQAMNDPRYEKDAAYRNEVLRKMQNSAI